MLISKIKLENGFMYFDINPRYNRFSVSSDEWQTVSVTMIADRVDENPHEMSFWDTLDSTSVKGMDDDTVCYTHRCTTSILIGCGEDSNLTKMSDWKHIINELSNIIRWLRSIGKKVHFSPVDARRTRATEYMLKKCNVEFYTYRHIPGDSDIYVK